VPLTWMGVAGGYLMYTVLTSMRPCPNQETTT
jgi:hypothetical protein